MQTKSAIDIENVECTVNSGGMDGLTTGCTTWWSGSTTVCAAGAAARVRWAAAAAAAWCGARPDDEDDDVDMPTYGVWCACLRGSVAASSSCSYTRQHIDVKNVFTFFIFPTFLTFFNVFYFCLRFYNKKRCRLCSVELHSYCFLTIKPTL